MSGICNDSQAVSESSVLGIGRLQYLQRCPFRDHQYTFIHLHPPKWLSLIGAFKGMSRLGRVATRRKFKYHRYGGPQFVAP